MTSRRTLRRPHELALWAALPMAHTPRIEGRLKMILDHTRSRRALTRRVLLAALGFGTAALVPLAMLRPAARAQASPPQASPPQASPPPKRHMTRETARVSAVSAVLGEFDAMRLVGEGRSLTPQAAAGLERALALRPDDYAAHIRLLGYYGGHRFQGGPAKASYQQQVFWFIRNHPESVLSGTPETMLLKREDPAAFEEGKALWLEQISKQPDNTTLLGKAAGYCTLSDEETAERLLQQAQVLEPKNPLWPGKLGFLYQLQGNGIRVSAGDSRLWARKALAEYEAAAEVSTNKTLQHSTSADLAMTAFDAGEYDKARRYAVSLLQRGQNKKGYSWNTGGDLHRAHLILGRLALRDGDTAEAEAHLLAMGRVSDSPVLASFGPNMRLAQELLKAGRRDVVLAYFDECAKFWTFDHGEKLKQWKTQVQKGEVPDFGGNLVY